MSWCSTKQTFLNPRLHPAVPIHHWGILITWQSILLMTIDERALSWPITLLVINKWKVKEPITTWLCTSPELSWLVCLTKRDGHLLLIHLGWYSSSLSRGMFDMLRIYNTRFATGMPHLQQWFVWHVWCIWECAKDLYKFKWSHLAQVCLSMTLFSFLERLSWYF